MSVPLFYYTRIDEFKCICQLGLIWTSSRATGDGVYLTEMPPSSGRTKIAEHLYKDHEDKYAMTEVCLETNSALVPVEKLPAHPEGHIWMSKTQLAFSSFSAYYHAVWERTAVKTFIKTEHLTMDPYSESPISKLQEIVCLFGTVPTYTQLSDSTSANFVCKVSAGSESALGQGDSEQKAKTEAAKHLLRTLVLATFKNAKMNKEVDEEKIVPVNVKTKDKETSLNGAGNLMSVGDRERKISGSKRDRLLASTKDTPNYGNVSKISSDSINVISSAAIDVGYNPVGKLQEYCVNKGLSLPNYDDLPLSKNQEPSKINFAFVVKVGGVSCKGFGWTKKCASKAAAEQILYKLGIIFRDDTLVREIKLPNERLFASDSFEARNEYISNQMPSNPVGMLQEFCAAKRLTLPIYYDVREMGPPHANTFTVQCSLLGHSENGSGSSKKNAKHNAALKMWKRLTIN